jgi:serine protease Do
VGSDILLHNRIKAYRKVKKSEHSDQNEKINNFYKYHIKFTKNKTKHRLNYVFKITSFVAIAAFSGALSGIFTVNKIYSNNKLYASKEYYSICDLYKNIVNTVSNSIGPSLVGVSNKKECTWQDYEDNGTGVIISTDGYIMSSSDLVGKKENITVRLYNGNIYKANVVGSDKTSNLAILKIDENNLQVAQFGDSSKAKIGDFAIAIGNPLGEKHSIFSTVGIISAINTRTFITKDTGRENVMYNVLETDASINSRNIGGALCDSSGKIIGINNSYTVDKQGKTNGVAYAISINEIKEIIDSFMDNGYVLRARLGIYGGTAVPIDNNGVEGIYVQHVVKGSGAEKANIRPTDIIVQIDNIATKKIEDLNDVFEEHKPGDKVKCKVWRNGEFLSVEILLSELIEK